MGRITGLVGLLVVLGAGIAGAAETEARETTEAPQLAQVVIPFPEARTPPTQAPVPAAAPPTTPTGQLGEQQLEALRSYRLRRLRRGTFPSAAATWATGMRLWQGGGVFRPARARLLTAFGDLDGIRAATPEQLAAVAWPTRGEAAWPRARRLDRAIEIPVFTGIVKPGGLTVLDGHGAPLSAPALALRLGETGVLDRIDRRAEAAAWVGIVGNLASVILIGLGTIDLRAAGSPIPGEVPVPLASLAVERGRRGSALVAAGVGLSVGSISFVFGTASYNARAQGFWTEDELDTLLERHNEALRQELGLAREVVLKDELGLLR